MSGGRVRLLGLAALVACGKMVAPIDAGPPDATIVDAAVDASDAAPPDDGGWVVDWNACDAGAALGLWCATDADCCSGHCFHGSCQRPACTSDDAGCALDSECCSGKCAGGACAPLSAVCKVLGNACAQGSECCSLTCLSAICVQPSYCGQIGDVCVTGSDCCGQTCTHPPGSAFGRCDLPFYEGCAGIDGTLCGAGADGGAPACGSDCCGRNCAAWGPLGSWVCLPSSGCQPTGGLCRDDSDCCHDGNGLEVCLRNQPSDAVGRCSNPTGCKPNGNICRLAANLCNATDNCCSGNVEDAGTCALDENGAPRCSFPRDAGTCAAAGGACASSADCCGAAPCVPAGDAGFVCYNITCVPHGGACTADGDCCVGQRCDQATRTCRPFALGCALYGQTCGAPSDCCNGVPCTGGRCAYATP